MEKYVKITAQTDVSTGEATITFKIPGTFVTIDPKQPDFSGRTITEWMIWCKEPLDGDAVTSITIEDTDGKIPMGQRPAFPDYPIIAYRQDTEVDEDNQGFYLTKTPIRLTPPGLAKPLPSELYIILVLQKADTVQDDIYINLKWEDGAAL